MREIVQGPFRFKNNHDIVFTIDGEDIDLSVFVDHIFHVAYADLEILAVEAAAEMLDDVLDAVRHNAEQQLSKLSDKQKSMAKKLAGEVHKHNARYYRITRTRTENGLVLFYGADLFAADGKLFKSYTPTWLTINAVIEAINEAPENAGYHLYNQFVS